MASAAEVIAAGLNKLREQSSGELESLRIQLEERYRGKFKAYRKREEALVAQVKHAVERAERFGRYEAEQQLKSKVLELEARVRDIEAEKGALRRRHYEQLRVAERRRVASEVRAQRACNEVKQCVATAQQINKALRLRFREVVGDVHRELSKKLRARIQEEIEAELYEELQPRVEESLREELRSSMREEYEHDLRLSIREEIEEELRLSIREEIEEELRLSLREEIEEELRPSIRAKLEQELLGNMNIESRAYPSTAEHDSQQPHHYVQHGHNLCLRKQKEEEIGIDQNTACSQHQNSSERPKSYNYASDTSLRQEIPQPMQSPVSETPKTAHEERDASSDSAQTRSGLKQEKDRKPHAIFNNVFKTFDPLHRQHLAADRTIDAHTEKNHAPPIDVPPHHARYVNESLDGSRIQSIEDSGADSNGFENSTSGSDEAASSENLSYAIDYEEEDNAAISMPCKSTKKRRREMRAMIIGQPKQQYAQSLFHETRAHESSTADQSEPECDTEYLREIEADTDHEDEEEYHDTILAQWRCELEEEAHFLREVQVPLVSKDASSPSGRVNASTFSSIAEQAAELFELWNSLGVSYGARRRTLRALHVTAGKSSSPEKVLQLIADMRVKLKAMHKVVRREMAAVRRCDQLLREQDMTELQQQQLPKLISVLERVLPKWEKEKGRPFLFRGIRYLDLMTILSKHMVKAEYHNLH
eukprot:g1371.t1